MVGFKYILLSIILLKLTLAITVSFSSSLVTDTRGDILFDNTAKIKDYLKLREDSIASRVSDNVTVHITNKTISKEEIELCTLSVDFLEKSFSISGEPAISSLSLDGKQYKQFIPVLRNTSFLEGSLSELGTWFDLKELERGEIVAIPSKEGEATKRFRLYRFMNTGKGYCDLSNGIEVSLLSKVLPQNTNKLYFYVLKDLQDRKYYVLSEFTNPGRTSSNISIENLVLNIGSGDRSIKILPLDNRGIIRVTEVTAIIVREEIFENEKVYLSDTVKITEGEYILPPNVVSTQLILKAVGVPYPEYLSIKIK